MDSFMPLARGGQVDMCPIPSQAGVTAGYDWPLPSLASLGTGNLSQCTGFAAPRSPVMI